MNKGNALIEVNRASRMIDEPISLRITGLHPQWLYELDVEMLDDLGRTWCARAQFEADHNGELDTAIHPARSGSYCGIMANGLFWSMQLKEQAGELSWEHAHSIPFYMKMSLNPNRYNVKVYEQSPVQGNTYDTERDDTSKVKTIVAEHSFEMDFVAEHVQVLDVTEGFIGQYYMPATSTTTNKEHNKLPGVIVVGGSGGGFGWSTHIASVLASRGIAAMAVAYFDYQGSYGLPHELVNIPLEQFGACINWLQQRAEVDSERIGVVGISKGGELALLLGSTYHESISSVVAIAPAHIVMQGISMTNYTPQSSWSYAGAPLAFLPYPDDYAVTASFDKSSLRDTITRALQNSDAVEQSRIPVERMSANVLLISGDQDEMGPTSDMSLSIVHTLSNYEYSYKVKHLRYPDAGHSFFLPNLPAVVFHPNVSPAAVAAAEQHAWKAIVSFLQKTANGHLSESYPVPNVVKE
ncbi:acyl-CoA thioesterase/bile acid-CoA:amino acid N-acyltransferase family protein [Paenibacillus arenosi]|uniref:Acyl-CoA thioesterase/BAAT N-terminal domain-containing protein n=1 Tax=Paenibacillus arenosi TaxID=2774142 RepID=A0ABR9B064_9BACL|nr:acyl-CoA thioesterase/bile acid-CoA:amino acid N-acyltransferase family protein [Paenibacillus arenosi]MBD8499794.1 acyl-CoA thioesterase/BAAT N-terminal domain-containing protein [Paenibacillus arenosi]